MWNLLKFLFIGKWACSHKWEEKEVIKVFGDDKTIPKAFLIVLKCKHCGEIKQKRIGG